MASIAKKVSKAGEVIYYVVFRKDGRQVWQKAGSRKTDANQLKTKIEHELYSGAYRATSDITFAEYANKWLEDKKVDVALNTHYFYRSYTRGQITPFFSKIKLKDITKDNIKDFKKHLFKEGKTPANIGKYLTILKIILNQAVEDEYIGYNPSKSIKNPKVDKKFEPMFLSPVQLKKLVDTAPDKHKALIATACFTGMRQSELLGLKWGDIGFANKKIYVKRTLQWGQFLDPKTASSRRSVDIPSFVCELLKEHQIRQLVDLPENPHSLVFPNTLGKPMDARGLLKYIFEPVLKISGLPPIRFHDLRHSYASMLIHEGANIKYVQKQLGHSTVQMTLNTYSHLLPDAGSEAIEKLDSLLCDKTESVFH